MSFKKKGFIRKNMKEAVIPSQISPAAREKVRKAKAGHKKLGQEILANKIKTTDNFHMLSPLKKEEVKKKMGFGVNTKEQKTRGGTKIVFGSETSPDDLFGVAKSPSVEDGKTFIYNTDTKRIVFSIPSNPHFEVREDQLNLGGLDDEDIESMYESGELIDGRWIKFKDDAPVRKTGWTKGMAGKYVMSTWSKLDEAMVKEIIAKLKKPIDVAHVPWETTAGL